MAKIRAKGNPRKKSGPVAPSAIGCVFLVVMVFGILGALLYFGISRAS